MRTSSIIGIALIAGAFGVLPARAFDVNSMTADTPPAEAFSYGLNQYKSGDKLTAVEALSFAAGKGVAGAQWKLANMYAEGDGVDRNEVKAFELFSEVVSSADADEMTVEQSAPYVSNAFVRLGAYYRQGIPNSKIKPDLWRARQLYYNAASIFGNADAQLALARMSYDGEGGDRDLIQAAKWANLAAEKGNPAARDLAIQVSLDLANAHLEGKGVARSTREAAKWARQAADYGSIDGQALLGHILFEGDGVTRQPVDGLTLLTIALIRSGGNERWIADLHEDARSAATEAEWNAAKARAEDWLAANPAQVASNSGS
jgi:TPR repeat protein